MCIIIQIIQMNRRHCERFSCDIAKKRLGSLTILSPLLSALCSSVKLKKKTSEMNTTHVNEWVEELFFVVVIGVGK